ncbi:MAG: TA system VapC family ribonuclease toxin [Candidatus Korobacteraceae bacterium]
MSALLLDVNILVALVRSRHSHHGQVKRWFSSAGRRGWATCALTQAGFVRVVSNPRFTKEGVDVGEAMRMLAELTSLPGHQFWPVDFDFSTAVDPFAARFFGHQQVTDIYLLALAVRNKGKVVTLDQGFESLAGNEFGEFVTVL